tara:strand:+ start:320 stop:565 length:246 start_codon:yes stop_codon:yes gene_type:complete
MNNTVFNLTLGKYSFKTTKLPAPNQNFKLNEKMVKILNNTPGKTDWWKPFLYQLSNGNKCFGLSSEHKKVLEHIGLTVLEP